LFWVEGEIMGFFVAPLEGVLRGWEDCMYLTSRMMFLGSIKNGFQPFEYKDGPVGNFSTFREFLLRLGSKQADISDFEEKYLPGVREDSVEYEFGIPSLFGDFSIQFMNWSLQSRRVYSLDRITQLKIENTSLEDIPWENFHFPFDSFLIQVPFPLPHWSGEGEYCWILFSKLKIGSVTSFKFMVIEDATGNYRGLSNAKKKKLQRHLDRKEFELAEELIKTHRNDLFSNMLLEGLTLTKVASEHSVTETVENGLQYFVNRGAFPNS
jgi:hypothetical protein